MSAKILVVDDEDTFRSVLSDVLTKEGYEVSEASDGNTALELIKRKDFDVIICDLRMPGMGGLEVLQHTLEIKPQTSFVLVTAYGSVENAVEAMKQGACDYLMKPVVLEDVALRIKRVLSYNDLTLDNQLLRQQLDQQYYHDIIGESAAVQEMLQLVKKVADARSTVLITGESGTGKELVARAIHYTGHRRQRRFVTINCGAIPENLLESEVFGHVKGSFTGATEDKKGLFAVADGGTLFLDEISTMTMTTQVKLLRVLQEKEFLPIGATEPLKVDTRIIAATNQDLAQAVKAGKFREDLFYRLDIVQIGLPPLRERKDDISDLAEHFVNKYNHELKKRCKGVNERAMAALSSYNWPGNIRELENVIERAMILAESEWITPDDLPSNFSNLPASSDEHTALYSLKRATKQFEQKHIFMVLERTSQDKARAAELLGISVSSLYRKLEEMAS